MIHVLRRTPAAMWDLHHNDIFWTKIGEDERGPFYVPVGHANPIRRFYAQDFARSAPKGEGTPRKGNIRFVPGTTISQMRPAVAALKELVAIYNSVRRQQKDKRAAHLAKNRDKIAALSTTLATFKHSIHRYQSSLNALGARYKIPNLCSCGRCGAPMIGKEGFMVEVYDTGGNVCHKCAAGLAVDPTNPNRFATEAGVAYKKGVLPYSTNVLEHTDRPFFTTKDEDFREGRDLALGVELEIGYHPEQTAFDIVKQIRHVAPFAIVKDDSSLGNNGFEVVSAPCSLAFHREGWTDFFKIAAVQLRGETFTQAGMHVHLDAASFSSPLSVAKYIEFMNNTANFNLFISQVAERVSTQYANPSGDKVVSIIKGNMRAMGKYYCANLCHDRTIEVRIFTSTNNYDVFRARLDFCAAVYRFAHDTSIKQLGYEHFLTWFFQKGVRQQFPFFFYWLTTSLLGGKFPTGQWPEQVSKLWLALAQQTNERLDRDKAYFKSKEAA